MTSIRLEAENMTLNGYETEAQSFASGGKLIRIPNIGSIGKATANFTGASGLYDVRVGYHDENDGVSNLSVKVGGQLVDSWSLNQNLGSTRATATNFLLRNVASGLSVNAGEAIEIQGTLNNGEVARVDYIEFIPINVQPQDTTAPTASLNAQNLDTTAGANAPYTFTVTYTDNVGVNVSSLDNSDIQVSGPNRVSQSATLVGVNANTDGTPRTATYQLNAPGGSWDSNEAGTYNLSLGSNQVSDPSNNFVAGGALGSFQVNVAALPPTGSTANYSSAPRGIIARLDSDFVLTPKFDRPLKIMPLGDSITQGKVNRYIPEAEQEGYRKILWDKFTDLGLDIDYMGPGSNGTSNLPDKNHAGYPGKNITYISGEITSLLNTYQPDTILLKIGTNDAGGDPVKMTTNISRLIDRITTNASFTGDLFVSSLAPVHPKSYLYAARMPNILTYNAALPGVVNSKPASEKVRFVDIWAGENGIKEADMTAPPDDNGLHPSVGGYAKIAQFWYDAVLNSGAAGQKDTVSDANLIGSAYDDLLVGDAANNILTGGDGNDTLTGGSGADSFAYSVPGDGEDLLTDFSGAQSDRIQIAASGFGGGLSAGVNLSATASATGTFVSDSTPTALGTGANFLYDTDTGWLGFDVDGTGAGTAVTLATLSGAPSLNASQFAIV